MLTALLKAAVLAAAWSAAATASKDSIVASPILTVAMEPAGPGTTSYGTELRVRKDVAISQDVVNFAVPTGLNWNLQSPGAAVTVARVFCWAVANAGLAAQV